MLRVVLILPVSLYVGASASILISGLSRRSRVTSTTFILFILSAGGRIYFHKSPRFTDFSLVG